MKKYITYVIGGLLLTFQLLLSSCNNSKLEALKLSHSELNLLVGKDQRLEVIHIPIEATPNNRVSWKSSDRRVATVSNSGLVTAVYSVTCVITAYCGEIEVKCTINVSPIRYQLELCQGIGDIFGDESGIVVNHLCICLLDTY